MQASYNPNMDRNTRLILTGLGIAAAGGATFVGLLASGVLESDRATGAGLMNAVTFTGTKVDFIRNVMEAAARVDSSLSQRTRILLAAWAAHESGWGKGTKQAQVAFNLWNVSAGSAWLNANKPVMSGKDTEFSVGSILAKKITQQWRVYGSLDESIADLLKFLQNGYLNYKEAYSALLAGDETFATSLGVFDKTFGIVTRVDDRAGTAGFYTLPRSQYQAAISKLATEVGAIASGAGLAGLRLVRSAR